MQETGSDRKKFAKKASGDLQDLKVLINEAIRYTRELMSDLKPPPTLEAEGIRSSVDWVVGTMKKHGIEVTVDEDHHPKPLDVETKTLLIQFIRELLFNVVKHASVKKAHIYLSRKNNHIQVTVEDEGKGFDVREEGLLPTG